MSNEEVKEEVKKTPEEVEEVLKKEAEEVPEEVEQRNELKFTNIQKLKCNYTVYKRERTNLKMPIVEKCQICGKNFKDGDELYTACTEKDDIKQNFLICKNCAQ